jgi:predicted nucleic acid-binding protein
MARRLLDTSVLVSWWRRKGGRGSLEKIDDDVRNWSEELLELHAAAGIVSPVYIEFVCGFTESRRLHLGELFLEVFDVLDHWKVGKRDLDEARNIARRIPRNRKPRQLGDCLIRALANRLNYEVVTTDQSFPA